MHKKKHFGLNLCLALFIFITGIITMVLIGTVIFCMLHFHIFSNILLKYPIINLFFALAVLSIVVSTCITSLIAQFPLRPLRRIIEATDALAEGNFKTRIHLEYPTELRNLSESFNTMASELEHTTMLRNDFINNFSHEFKTPIVSIKGFAKLLQTESLPKEKQQEYLNIIIHESDRLANMATKVLDLSKVENQTELAHVTTYNLAEQIRLAFLLLENKWDSREIEFSIDLEEIQISANEEMMQQVFVNLLDNAIKFTPDGGSITLSLKTVEDQICFELTDTGIGMDEQTKSHLFLKFYQADTSHQQEGNGLGMTLVKQIIDLHGGTIQIDSQLRHGTKITVQLPCYR
jgi:signal transduction histidine kinase